MLEQPRPCTDLPTRATGRFTSEAAGQGHYHLPFVGGFLCLPAQFLKEVIRTEYTEKEKPRNNETLQKMRSKGKTFSTFIGKVTKRRKRAHPDGKYFKGQNKFKGKSEEAYYEYWQDSSYSGN